MDLQHSEFVADVAVIYGIGCGKSYGSGRLIAPGLIITAAHLVQEENGSTCLERDWNILLLRDFNLGTGWEAPYKAKVAWVGKDGLDMAVLRIQPVGEMDLPPRPTVEPIYVSYDDVRSLEVRATGFPEAWRDEGKTRDLTVPGTLWVSTRDGPYTWNAILRPDRREGWKGMSGAVVCLPSEHGRLYLFGVVQQVPANFSQGSLDVARVSFALTDQEFCRLVKDSTGVSATLLPFSGSDAVSTTAVTLRSSFPALVEGTSGNPRIKLEAFFAEYLLRPSAPLRFLGRGSEFDHLDAWLSSPEASYFALVGPAGRGKSALAVQWAAKVSERGDYSVVLLPISARFDLTRSDELLKLLATRLQYLCSKNLELDNSPDRLIDEIHAILGGDRVSFDKQLLIIIDGWDEAQEPKWLRFPYRLGKGVKVLVSSRLLVNEVQVKDASGRLGIPASAAGLLLSPLSKRDLSEVRIGLDEWIPGVVDWLWQYSDGDPLLVRLYLDWISDRKERGQTLLPSEPDRVEVGLDRYMRMWWNETYAAAGTIGADHVKLLLHTLALARGPLTFDDLMEITGLDPLDVASACGPLRRLIVGNGHNVGYAFNHPRIGQFVAEELMTTKARATMEEKFVAWCTAVACALKAEVYTGKPVSAYVLSFCIDHFENRGRVPADYVLLLSAGWMRAHHALDGHYSGLVVDLLRIHAIALKSDDVALGAACVLARAVVVTLSNAAPAGLLRMAIDEGLITGIQAVEEINTVRDQRARALALSAVADSLNESVALRAADIAWNISQREERLLALASLAGQMASSKDAFTADIEYERPNGTVIALLLLRTAFANLGFPTSEPLTVSQESQLDDELSKRIWATSDLDKYILWARETAQVLLGDARDIFVRWVANSVRHRSYKWEEKNHIAHLICALAQYAPSDILTAWEAVLNAIGPSFREVRANLLGRRMTLGLSAHEASMIDALDMNRPWSCVSLLPHMDKASAQQWAQRCLSAAAAHDLKTRWQDILQCLAYAGCGDFVKQAWLRIRKVQASDAVCDLARAILPKMQQKHRAHASDRFLERLEESYIRNALNIPNVATVARTASSKNLRYVRQLIDESPDGLLVLIARLEPDERYRLIASVLNQSDLRSSLFSILAECFDMLSGPERRELANACLDRITGNSSDWSFVRSRGVLHAELIEALAPQIISTLGIEAIVILRGAAEKIVFLPNRALALSALAGCSSGNDAVELATVALAAYTSEDEEHDINWWKSRPHDVRTALSILSDFSLDQLFFTEREIHDVGQLLKIFRDEQASSIGGQILRHWELGDRNEIVQLLESLSVPVSRGIDEFFSTLVRLTPTHDKWVRQLWTQGLAAASTEGYRGILFYITMSAPSIDSVLNENEINEVVEGILDVSCWEWQ